MAPPTSTEGPPGGARLAPALRADFPAAAALEEADEESHITGAAAVYSPFAWVPDATSDPPVPSRSVTPVACTASSRLASCGSRAAAALVTSITEENPPASADVAVRIRLTPGRILA
jgi:hypothetical protein